MVIEAFVSFETGKLLKEKGFDADTKMFWCTLYDVPYIEYIGDIENCSAFEVNNSNGLDVSENFVCTAPTQQMAMRWLREVHKIHIIAEPCLGLSDNLEFNRWFSTIFKEEGEYKPIRRVDEYSTYEDAVEAACLYCLRNLI